MAPPGEIVNKKVCASGPADFSIHRPCFREGEFLKTPPRQVSPLSPTLCSIASRLAAERRHGLSLRSRHWDLRECPLFISTLFGNIMECRNLSWPTRGHTLYMKVSLSLHVGRVVQLYTIHENLLHFSCWVCSPPIYHTWKLASLRGCVYSSWPKRDTHYTQETWLTFHVGCIEGMAEKGHTIHENLACFTCWDV